jgi:hypothetical protein
VNLTIRERRKRYRKNPNRVWYEKPQWALAPDLRALKRLYWKALQREHRAKLEGLGKRSKVRRWCKEVFELMARWRPVEKFSRSQIHEVRKATWELWRKGPHQFPR